MKIIKLDPKDRIVSLQINEDKDRNFQNLIVNIPKYYCPDCDEITAFTINSEKKTDIPKDVRKAFDEKTNIKNKYEEGFIDLSCRLCGKPARLVYSIYEFHMASYKYYAKEVLEIK